MRHLLVGSAIVIAIVVTLWRWSDWDMIPIPPIFPELSIGQHSDATAPADMHTEPDHSDHNHSDHAHFGHDHTNHDQSANAAQSQDDLPPELEAFIESQRKEASEIEVVPHGDGTATVHTGNQFSTVLMVVIDDDGNRRMVERQITPKGQIVIPAQSN